MALRMLSFYQELQDMKQKVEEVLSPDNGYWHI